jgi:hypothetical protein
MDHYVCEKCGQEVFIGEWPFCFHGSGNNLQKPMEPHVDDMIASHPVEFRTIGEKVRYMDRNAIVPRGEARNSGSSGNLNPHDVRAAIREAINEVRR